MSDALDRIVPEATDKNPDLYRHSDEGPDDLPAHVKSSLIGTSVTIPIKNGKLVCLPYSVFTLDPDIVLKKT